MYIKNIFLENFRNYNQQKIEFDKNINIIYGDNAQGKTNILEAIFVCGLGKSFRTNKDKEMININKNFLNVEINIEKTDRKNKVKLEISKNENKTFKINDIKINKISDVLGNIYVVLFTPEDIGIINNDPIKRRKFLNIMISQLKPIYVHQINKYNKILEQRNNYLKQIKFESKAIDVLEIWDEQIVRAGKKIYNYRKEFIEKINNKINQIHLKTTQNKETIEIKYISNIKDETKYKEELLRLRRIDIERGFTTVGIHRDDFEIFLNKKSLSIYGSQGQKRTTIISLKLAEAEVIYDEIGDYPILLLDDFMSELDKKRIQGLLENIKNNQVLITCTDDFKINNSKYNLYKVTNAQVETIENKNRKK